MLNNNHIRHVNYLLATYPTRNPLPAGQQRLGALAGAGGGGGGGGGEVRERPYFDDVSPRNVTAVVGQSAVLRCRAKHIGNRTLTVDADIDNHWDSVKHTVKTTAVKVLGRKRNTKRRKWWNQDCEEIVKERRKCKIQAENNEEWVAKYKKVQTEARTIIKRAKRQHLDNIVRGMETLLRANESRKFYKEVSSCKKGYQPTAQFLEDDDGNLISDRDTIMTCWRDYFQQLLNCQPLEEQVPRSMEHNSEIVEPPTFEEVREAIMRLKNHKAPGIDDLPSELWKYGGGRVQLELFQLLCKIWEEEKQPKEWNLGVICPVHKKGSKKKCTNYRGIALLPTAYKVLSYVLLKRLEPYTEKILGDYQCGFRRNRSTVDQIFLLKQLMEKKWEYAQSIHSLFVDFTKAYDSIDREALFTILRNFKIPAKIVSMVEVATKESRMKVRVGGELTEEFAVVTGLKQGDALSPMLFNLALEHVLRGVLELDFGLQLNGKHKVVGYADDLAVLGKTAEEVRKAAKLLDTEAGKIGLRINRGKSEYLHMKRYKDKSVRRQDLHVGDVTYKGVSRFKYLGCTVTDTNTRDEEIDTRIQSFLRCSAALHKVLTSRLLSRNTKLRIYKTVIRPILMYGCEAWTLTQKEESKLLVAERKVLRKIFGPRQRPDGSWRVLKNAELEDLMAGANIVGETKAHRLRWLGHLQRMGEDRSAKRAYMGRPTGRRPVGRPRYRWSDAVEADLRELQVVDWRETALDRQKWRSLVSEAKTHFGSLSQRSNQGYWPGVLVLRSGDGTCVICNYTSRLLGLATHVSWMRKRDLHILTSHIFTYTGDARFSVLHPEPSDDWDLRVDYVQPRDAGVYECQINTEPKINMAVFLTVEGDC
ncbi:unnamed protein product [Plutella xylostella]|uniref:(diamondback moth) hypothetical protein n=1 Tax=Plutella xylostella TaxID=51655 RepID=A0A8S4G7I7_PLUXY|nr:unnamed protein product [Plutella xylostella]